VAAGAAVSAGATVTGGLAVDGGLTSGADVHVFSSSPEQILVNKQVGLAWEPSRNYILGIYGDCQQPEQSCLTGTMAAHDSNGMERFSVSDGGAVSQVGGLGVHGGLAVSDGGVAVDGGFRVSLAASVNGGASVVGGADIADRLGIHHGSIRVASADLDLHGTASVSQSVRIAGYGMSATGQVSIRAGGMAVGLDGVSAAGGVHISGVADVYSPVTISDSFIVSRGVVLAAGDLLVSSGGVEIRCGASSLNTHATVAQGATLGSRVEIGGALNALQGAAVQGGVRVANDGVNVNSGLSIHGGFSTAGGLAVSDAGLSVSGRVHVPADAGSVAGGLHVHDGAHVHGDMLLEQLVASSSVVVQTGGMRVLGGKVGLNGPVAEASLDVTAVAEVGHIAFAGRGSAAFTVAGAYTEGIDRDFSVVITNAVHVCEDTCATLTVVLCVADDLCQVTGDALAPCVAIDTCMADADLPANANQALTLCEQSPRCVYTPQTVEWSSCVADVTPAICDSGSTTIFSAGIRFSLGYGLSAMFDYSNGVSINGCRNSNDAVLVGRTSRSLCETASTGFTWDAGVCSEQDTEQSGCENAGGAWTEGVCIREASDQESCEYEDTGNVWFPDSWSFRASPSRLLAVQSAGGTASTVVSPDGAVVSSGGASFANGATVTTGPLHVLSEGVYVADGGADVAGGATVDAGVLWVRDGGAAVDGGATLRGGVTVADEGLTVASGGVAVNDGGCAIAGGLAISCGGVTVSSGPVDASGGLQVFAGRTHVGMGLRLTGNGARVDSGVSVLAGGSLLHGSVSIRDLGVDVIGPSTFRGGLGIHGGTSVAGSDIQVAGGIAVSNGRLGLGSNDMFSQIAARGQSSIGPVVSQSDPSDVVFDGPYTGSSYPARIEVQIDSLAGAGHSTDTFAWFKCGIVDGGKARLHPSPSIALPGHAIEQHRNDPVTENGTRANC
jgi:hypothetical protein